MRIKLENTDDNALAYLAHILPCMSSCNLTSIVIPVEKSWSASTETCQMADDALLLLAQSTVSKVLFMVDPDADVPSWGALPYECEDDLCKKVLPRCVAGGVIRLFCREWPVCRLHNPERCHLHTHGTLRELLDILSAWTCPVKQWEMTTQTSVLESLGDFSQELQRAWEEISRVFVSSMVVRPRSVCIAFHIAGLGTLELGSYTGTSCFPLVSLLAKLVGSQALLQDTVCGPDSTTWTTAHWPTWPAFSRTSRCAA